MKIKYKHILVPMFDSGVVECEKLGLEKIQITELREGYIFEKEIDVKHITASHYNWYYEIEKKIKLFTGFETGFPVLCSYWTEPERDYIQNEIFARIDYERNYAKIESQEEELLDMKNE